MFSKPLVSLAPSGIAPRVNVDAVAEPVVIDVDRVGAARSAARPVGARGALVPVPAGALVEGLRPGGPVPAWPAVPGG